MKKLILFIFLVNSVSIFAGGTYSVQPQDAYATRYLWHGVEDSQAEDYVTLDQFSDDTYVKVARVQRGGENVASLPHIKMKVAFGNEDNQYHLPIISLIEFEVGFNRKLNGNEREYRIKFCDMGFFLFRLNIENAIQVEYFGSGKRPSKKKIPLQEGKEQLTGLLNGCFQFQNSKLKLQKHWKIKAIERELSLDSYCVVEPVE